MSASLSLELSLWPSEARNPARDISIQSDIEDRANVDNAHVSHMSLIDYLLKLRCLCLSPSSVRSPCQLPTSIHVFLFSYCFLAPCYAFSELPSP